MTTAVLPKPAPVRRDEMNGTSQWTDTARTGSNTGSSIWISSGRWRGVWQRRVRPVRVSERAIPMCLGARRPARRAASRPARPAPPATTQHRYIARYATLATAPYHRRVL